MLSPCIKYCLSVLATISLSQPPLTLIAPTRWALYTFISSTIYGDILISLLSNDFKVSSQFSDCLSGTSCNTLFLMFWPCWSISVDFNSAFFLSFLESEIFKGLDPSSVIYFRLLIQISHLWCLLSGPSSLQRDVIFHTYLVCSSLSWVLRYPKQTLNLLSQFLCLLLQKCLQTLFYWNPHSLFRYTSLNCVWEMTLITCIRPNLKSPSWGASNCEGRPFY